MSALPCSSVSRSLLARPRISPLSKRIDVNRPDRSRKRNHFSRTEIQTKRYEFSQAIFKLSLRTLPQGLRSAKRMQPPGRSTAPRKSSTPFCKLRLTITSPLRRSVRSMTGRAGSRRPSQCWRALRELATPARKFVQSGRSFSRASTSTRKRRVLCQEYQRPVTVRSVLGSTG